MPVPVIVPRAANLGLRAAGVASFLPPLLTRLVIGYAFVQTGRGKLANIDNVVSFFTDLGVPMPALNAAFVSRLEYYGGMILIVGLLTRVFAALLGSTMIVALMTADKADFVSALTGMGEKGLTDVVPVMYGMMLLWLLVSGPGLLSLDTLLARALGIGKPEAPESSPA